MIMNIDVKILNKISSKYIQRCVKGIIYYDQMEFISGAACSFNTQRSINVIHHINQHNGENYLKR